MFEKEELVAGTEPEILMEITMKNLLATGHLDLQDFLDRVDMLGALGHTVLISNYGEFHRLVNYLSIYTDKMIGLPLGIPGMHELFEEKFYSDLEGGILEGLGRLFKHGVKLYAYPRLMPDGSLVTASNFEVAPNLKHLYSHLLENRYIEGIDDYAPDHLPIRSADVLALIRRGDPSWEKMVPPVVAKIIRARRLFGCF